LNMSAQEVQALLGSLERYEPTSIDVLEEYVRVNVGNKSHHLEANLALVKLYQLYPKRLNLNVLELILAQALMNPKEQAFHLSLCMLPEKVCKEESIVKLTHLNDALNNAQFFEFWDKVRGSENVISNLPGFEEEIRDFIFDECSRAYKKASVPGIGAALGLSSPLQYLEARGSTVQGGDVIFSTSEASEPKVASRDSILFSQLSGILSSLH